MFADYSGVGGPFDQGRSIQERRDFINRLLDVEHDRHGLGRTAGIDASLGRLGDRGGVIKPRSDLLDEVLDCGLCGFWGHGVVLL